MDVRGPRAAFGAGVNSVDFKYASFWSHKVLARAVSQLKQRLGCRSRTLGNNANEGDQYTDEQLYLLIDWRTLHR